MNVDVIIQARMSSSRLPNKVMLKIDERSVLDYVIDQLKNCKTIGRIIIATTEDKIDKKIVEFAQKNKLFYFKGDRVDVLDRYYKCAKEFECKNIARVTSDCPLIDPEIFDKVVQEFFLTNVDYCTNKLPMKNPTFPQGTEVEAFTFSALERSWNNAKLPSEREHVTPYIFNHPEKFIISSIKNQVNLSKYRWTIDVENDIKFVREIALRIKKRPIYTRDILEALSKEPNLEKINSDHIHNEGYLKSVQIDKEKGF